MHKGDFARYIAEYAYRTLTWGQNHVPPGVRSIVGLMFIVGGVFGFLPILGFWMLPLGLVLISDDIPWLRRRRRRVQSWWLRRRRGPGDAPVHSEKSGLE